MITEKQLIDAGYIITDYAGARWYVPHGKRLTNSNSMRCPYCGAELAEGVASVNGPGGWSYSMYECGTESAPGSYIYSISFPTNRCLIRSYVYIVEEDDVI